MLQKWRMAAAAVANEGKKENLAEQKKTECCWMQNSYARFSRNSIAKIKTKLAPEQCSAATKQKQEEEEEEKAHTL